jgi:NAD(P)-dependent dehydrogenase (short-subunit alcohol dehydrogenase family)
MFSIAAAGGRGGGDAAEQRRHRYHHLGKRPVPPPQAAYTAAKLAQEGLMQCLAVDPAPYGIRVNTIAPGAAASNLSRDNPPPPQGDRKKIPRLPLGRIGEPEDIGDAAACIVTDAFRYQTGSTVLVDGGFETCGGPGARLDCAA